MYLKCSTCPKLGVTCKGPYFLLTMTPQQLISWCKERKKHLGLTNAKLAELSGMSQGTVDSLLANTHADFKFGTIQPMLKALVGGDWSSEDCIATSEDSSEELKALRGKVEKLESGIEWRDEKIALLNKDGDDLRKLIANTNARHAKSQDFLREQLRSRNKAVAVLSAFLGLAVAVIIGALIVDRLNGNVGFIWLDNLSMLFQGGARPPFIDWVT